MLVTLKQKKRGKKGLISPLHTGSCGFALTLREEGGRVFWSAGPSAEAYVTYLTTNNRYFGNT